MTSDESNGDEKPIAANEPQGDNPDAPSSGGPLSADQVKIALRRVKDPELNLNIIDLGLVYDIRVDGANVQIDMSLTSPGCPSGPRDHG